MWRRHCDTPPASDGVETAWRIHQAQVDWTGKVDSKATFALTFQSALLVFAGSLADEASRALDYVTLGLAVAILGTAAALSASVVTPSLRRGHLAEEACSNFIYFGHARYWGAEALTRELRHGDPLPQLSRQIVQMAKISWRKHIRVGWAIWLGVIGGLVLLVATALIKL